MAKRAAKSIMGNLITVDELFDKIQPYRIADELQPYIPGYLEDVAETVIQTQVLATNKGLVKGDCLIDDNVDEKGQETFEGELIYFGSDEFPDWASVLNYFQKLTNYRIYDCPVHR